MNFLVRLSNDACIVWALVIGVVLIVWVLAVFGKRGDR